MTLEKESHARRTLLIVVAVTAFVNFSGVYPQFQLSPLQSLIQEASNLTDAQYVQVFSAANLPGVALSLLSGVLIDRFGYRGVIAWASVLTAIAAFGRIACGSFLPLFLASAVTGLIPTFVMSNAAKIISHYSRKEKVSLYIGIIVMGANLSSFLGAATSHRFSNVKSAYLAAGALCLLATVLWLVFVKEPKAGESDEEERVSIREALKAVCRSGRVWRLSLCLLFAQTVYISGASIAPSALRSVGYSAGTAGLIAGMLSIGCPLGSLLGSSLAIRSGRPKLFLIILAGVSAVLVPLFWASPILPVSMAAFLLAGFCTGTFIVTIAAIPITFSEVGQRYAGTAGGLLNTIMNLGGCLLPAYVITPLSGGDYRRQFLLLGTCFALACLTSFLIPKLPQFARQAKKE